MIFFIKKLSTGGLDIRSVAAILIMSFSFSIELKGYYIQGQPSSRRVVFTIEASGAIKNFIFDLPGKQDYIVGEI